MGVPARNRSRNKTSGSRIAALVVLVLIVGLVACYFLFLPPIKLGYTPQRPVISDNKPEISVASKPKTVVLSPPAVRPPPRKEQKVYSSTSPVPENKTGPDGSVSSRLAIIIDDMGSSLSEARSLAAIKVPLTFAIIPGLRYDKGVAEYATTKGLETLIHIPMQSKGWPERRLESNGLLVSMDAGELQSRVSAFVQQFPGAVGANNHMGSEFTEQGEKMEAVLQVLKEKNLFFIDSLTSPCSSGVKVAQRLDIRSARRHVFLDNEQERNYILGQLNQAVKMAIKNGSAIAICHPHPVTIATLASALPGLAGRGVLLVPASQLVK